MNKEQTYIICHYGEIGIKGDNRSFFENRLVSNIKTILKLQDISFNTVSKLFGRVVVELPSSYWEPAKKALSGIFGIVHFSQGFEVEKDIDSIKEAALLLIEDKDFNSFAIDTQRSDKSYPLTSQKVNEQVGSAVVEKYKKQVNLSNPDLTVFIEIVDGRVFIYTEKVKGPGGLPVSTGGKGMVLMSGDIDSPAAAYLIAKRGVKPVFVHFHSYPHTSKESLEKVRKLVKALNHFNFESILYMVPFADIQKEIISIVPQSLRIIFYRRFMMRIASELAKKENCQVLVTGESVGQVASQTVENIRSISDAADLPILRPLIGMDKEEIIQLAKKINTFNTSIRLDDDVCTRFMPNRPEIKSDLKKVRLEEDKLDVEKLVEMGITQAEREQVQGFPEN